MLKMYAGDPEAIKKHGEMLKALVNQGKTSETFLRSSATAAHRRALPPTT